VTHRSKPLCITTALVQTQVGVIKKEKIHFG